MPRRPRRSPIVRNASVPSLLPSRHLMATSMCTALVAGALCFCFVSNPAVATFVDSNRDLGVLRPGLERLAAAPFGPATGHVESFMPPVLPPRAVNDTPTNVRHETSNEAVRELTAKEQQRTTASEALDEAKRREQKREQEEEAQQRAVAEKKETHWHEAAVVAMRQLTVTAAQPRLAAIAAADAATHRELELAQMRKQRAAEVEPAEADEEPRNETKQHEAGVEEQQQRMAAPVKDVTDPAPFLSSFLGRVQALSFTVAQLAVGTVIGGRRLMM
jgi:hypothetical protein